MKIAILSKISDQTKREMVGVLTIAISFLVFVSLVSYNAEDLGRLTQLGGWDGFWYGLGEAFANQGGLLGALLATTLFYLLGYSALIFPVIFILMGVQQVFKADFKSVQSKLLNLFWCLFALGGLLAITQVRKEVGFSIVPLSLSGYLGFLSEQILRTLLGTTGAYVITICALILILYSFTPLRLSSLHRLEGLSRLPLALRRIGGLSLIRKLFERGNRDEAVMQPHPGAEERARPVRRRVMESPEAVTSNASPSVSVLQPGRQPRESNVSRQLSLPNWEGGNYQFPPLTMLNDPPETRSRVSPEELNATSKALRETLSTFGITIEGEIEKYPGPIITRFEFKPASGVKVNQVISLADDLALAMQAKRIRIVAPIPGKAAIGVEIPHRSPETVYLKEIITSKAFRENSFRLPLALGKDIAGHPFVVDLAKMPHLLIAGATGSGKSVCMNCIITSLVYRLHPEEVRFVMIDPKMLELSIYAGIPHLEKPVVVSHKVAERILQDAVLEMENRYKRLAKASVRNIEDFNAKGKENLPYIVIMIDELADLMMSGSAKSEMLITRLAQMARAVGIHLILATQRPSVDVITGLIKANFSSRIAFQVASKIDSRTILDANGAEKLLGSGDMLFLTAGLPEPARVHGAFVTSEETEKIVSSLKDQNYLPQPIEVFSAEETTDREPEREFDDDLLKEAAELVVRHKQGSVSLLQRRLGIGYQRAARLIDMLETKGVVGPYDGSKARQVLLDLKALEEKFPAES